MSLVTLRKCPIEGCYYNRHPRYADKLQVRNHIHTHDYKEKLVAAYNLSIISSLEERRAPQWLDEKLAEFTQGDF